MVILYIRLNYLMILNEYQQQHNWANSYDTFVLYINIQFFSVFLSMHLLDKNSGRDIFVFILSIARNFSPAIRLQTNCVLAEFMLRSFCPWGVR